jgi:protocatechuate 3,4-dioxygenase beta subunit
VGIAVPDRGDPPGLELRLPIPVALTGRVVGPKGEPVPRARVDFLRSHPVAANLVESTDADAQGRFSIPAFTAEDLDVELWVRRPGAPEDEGVEFHAIPRDGPVEIRLP